MSLTDLGALPLRLLVQHFGAGIVLSAVALELLPQITDTPKHDNTKYITAIIFGFFAGTYAEGPLVPQAQAPLIL
jgi:hypothetical protein